MALWVAAMTLEKVVCSVISDSQNERLVVVLGGEHPCACVYVEDFDR